MMRAVRLIFPDDLVRQPVISELALRFGVRASIRRAAVEEHVGWLICELEGDDDAVERGVAWLTESGVQVEALGDVVES